VVEEIPQVISDPVGVIVGLIAGIETGLDPGQVEALVAGVAGGRAKRRKLARALAGRPEILTDGRSPAPRALGDLLIALVKAGATMISPPVCAECGKKLRTLQRRGEDWYCWLCGPILLPCASCGLRRSRADIYAIGSWSPANPIIHRRAGSARRRQSAGDRGPRPHAMSRRRRGEGDPEVCANRKVPLAEERGLLVGRGG
jgi:hypothetical protein